MRQSKKVISGKDLESTKEWAKRIIHQWHDEAHPDYVFLTETAGTLYGYVLKEAWKNAYPHEKPPLFYRIDPNSDTLVLDQPYSRVKRYFTDRIKKENPKIIVFDEGHLIQGMESELEKETLLEQKNQFAEYSEGSEKINYDSGPKREAVGSQSVRRIANALFNYLTKKKVGGEIFCSRQGTPSITCNSIFGNTLYKNMENDPTRKISYQKSRRPTSKNYNSIKGPRNRTEDEVYQFEGVELDEIKLTGNIVKDSKQRKRALEYVRELRQIGREAGEELRKKREAKKKGLESVLGMISITGFLFSILSFSGITGNVIGTIETTNIIGTISVLIGLTFWGIYLYLKKKH